MAGRVPFKDGPHASRVGYRGEITVADMEALRAAVPSYVSDRALADLARQIMFAESDAKEWNAYVPTRDQLAQLKSLKSIAKRDKHVVVDMDGREHPFAELADALANLDQDTVELIKAADRGAIRAIIDRDGVFVDVEGNEHRRLPPIIQITRPFRRSVVVRNVVGVDEERRPVFDDWSPSMTPASVWFPRGIDGFVESVDEVISGLKMLQDDVGRREKSWQGGLAKVVVEFWETHCPNEPQAANRSSKTGKASPIVDLAEVVFAIVGLRLSTSRLASLLHGEQGN